MKFVKMMKNPIIIVKTLQEEIIVLTRKVHILRETDFNGALKVDFWYLKMKLITPNSIS